MKKLFLLLFLFIVLVLFKTDSVNAQTCPTPPANSGSIILTTTTTDGTYRVWARMKASDTNNNSFYIKVDDACQVLMGNSSQISSTNWTWVDYKDGNNSDKYDVTTTSGDHVITIYGNEPGVSIDKLLLTKNLDCVPVDFGDNCPAETANNTPVPFTITSNPAVSAITATGATITWTVSEGATGQVEYGPTTSYGTLSSPENTYTYSTHIQTLSNLTPGTLYHFRIKSSNKAGTQVISNDATFTTLSSASPTLTPTNTPSPTITPTLTPTPTDATSPSISITNPINGTTLRKGRSTTITASASDNVGINRVVFLINNSIICTDYTSSYTCSWRVPSKRNATYSISAIAYDAAGNSANSQIKVTAN
ncbi:MAG: Ig-like domain-containing protein [Patescibacteria group bacterium]